MQTIILFLTLGMKRLKVFKNMLFIVSLLHVQLFDLLFYVNKYIAINRLQFMIVGTLKVTSGW